MYRHARCRGSDARDVQGVDHVDDVAILETACDGGEACDLGYVGGAVDGSDGVDDSMW